MLGQKTWDFYLFVGGRTSKFKVVVLPNLPFLPHTLVILISHLEN